MGDALQYTKDELEKQMNLLEVHFKQSKVDPDFCLDCVRKHLNTIEGLSEEGIGFGESEEEKIVFSQVAGMARNLKRMDDLRERGPSYAEEVRKFRKLLVYGGEECPSCVRDTKDLYNSSPLHEVKDIESNEFRGEMMAKNKEIAVVVGSQFIGKAALVGGKYWDEKQLESDPALTWYKLPSTYIGIGGGLALLGSGVFLLNKSKHDIWQTMAIVTGSHLLTYSVDIVQKAMEEQSATTTAGVRARSRPAVRIRPSNPAGGSVMPNQRNDLVQID